jgi:hypothetical protein
LHALKALFHLGESSGRGRIFAFSHLSCNTAQVTEKQSTSVPHSQFLVEVVNFCSAISFWVEVVNFLFRSHFGG